MPLSPFHCRKSKKKPLEWIQSYEGVSFLGPKWPFAQKDIFLEDAFIHVCQHAKNQSQISIH